MHILSTDNIEQISREVNRADIKFSHLPDDLIDHICCDIEYRMNEGESFESAYNTVKEEIGIEGLKRIEDETIIFIHLNYFIMKKSMKVLTVATLILVVFSSLFKMRHWPGANILFISGFAVMLFGFIPMLFLLRNKEDKERSQVWPNLSAYVSSSLLCIGIVFKFMHWPGTGMLLMLTWAIIIFAFIPSFLIYSAKQKDRVKLTTNIGISLLLIIVLIISNTVNFMGRKADYRNHMTADNNITATTQFYTRQNEHLHDALLADALFINEKREALNNKLDAVDALRQKITALSDEIARINDFESLRLHDNRPDNYEAQIEQLKISAEALKTELLGDTPADSIFKKLVENTLETKKIGRSSAVNILFYQPMNVVINTLHRLNRDLLLIENILLRETGKR